MIINLFIVWRLGLLLITYLGSYLIPRLPNGALGTSIGVPSVDYWFSWAQWDGGHFFYIAQKGYQIPSDSVYMPLFPMAVRIADLIFKNTLISGLIVSNVSFFLFLLIFYKMLKYKFNVNLAKDTITTFLFFPTAFFCAAYYSESLFLLLSTACFFSIFKKQFTRAAIFASFAMVTRQIGIFLVISIIYSYLKTTDANLKVKIVKTAFFALITSAPAFAYTLFLNARFGNPFIFISSQEFWGRSIQDPISTIFSYIWEFINLQKRPPNDYFDFLATAFFIGILILGRKKISSSLWIFSVLTILIPASTSTLTSMPRYVLASLGSFVILAGFFQSHRALKITFWIISLSVQVVLATMFINGYWIA